MKRLIEQEAFHGADAYALGEMLGDLRNAVWSEAPRGAATDAYRRNLQRSYLNRMKTLLEDVDALETDVAPFVRGELEMLRGELEDAAEQVRDRATRLHFHDVAARIDAVLDPVS